MTAMWRCIAALLICGVWLGGCTMLETAALAPPADPLVEQILDSSSGAAVAREALFDRMAQADVIYLGELHDHPDHHRHQVEVIDAMIARGLKPAVGFERFSREKTGYLMSFSQLGSHDGSAAELAEHQLLNQLGFDGTDDPYWRFNLPKFERIREHALVAFGADLPAALRSRLAMVGLDGLSGAERSQIVASDLEDATYRALMYEEFKAGHCGYGPEPYLERLYDTWLARNEAMAEAIVATLESGERPVIFLTGNAHTRYGMGVVERVAHRLPGTDQVNVGLRNVNVVPAPAHEYIAATEFEGRDFGPDHGYIWLTRRHKPLQPDPCATFRKRLAVDEPPRSADAEPTP